VIVINEGSVIFDDRVGALKGRFIHARTIALKLAEPGFALDLPGVRVISAADYAVTLEVDTAIQPIDGVVGRIVAGCAVADITIEDPPMEQIIAAIYGEVGGG
jgi:ABC-2 type transport system ATP-binding protein